MKASKSILALVSSFAFAVTATGGELQTPGGPGAAAAGPIPAFEQFKAFLENPPAIEHLVVRQRVSKPSAVPRIADESFARSGDHRYFEARWQPGVGVFYRDLPELGALTNAVLGNNLVVRYGTDHWLVDGMPWIEHWVDHPQATDRDNDVTIVARFQLQALWEVLTFGVQHLEAGRIHWSGNRFAAHTPASPGLEAFDITGELFAGTNGLPGSMKLAYKWLGREASWVTKYRYEKPLEPAFLPSRIVQYWGARELGNYEILDLKTSSGSLPREEFDVIRFVQANGLDTRVFTNNQVYLLQSSGELKYIESLSALSPPGASLTHRQAVKLSYAVVSAFNLSILVLAVRMRKSGRKIR